MSLPPWHLVWDMLRLLLAPTLAASLLVMLALRVLGRERFAPLAAAVAIAAGVFAGNHFKETIEWQLQKGRPLTVDDLRTVLGWSLESKPSPTGALAPPMVAARYWLPWLGGLAMLVELLVGLPRVPVGLGWVLRALVAMFAGRLLTPESFRHEMPPDPDLLHLIPLQTAATPWLLGLAILLEWAILIGLSRKWQDGTPPGAMALCFAAAGFVLLLHHCGSCMDVAMLCCMALLGPALVAWKWPSLTGPALAAAAVALPGLMLTGLHDNATSSKVPVRSFLLVALAPLALAPLALPFLARQRGWKASLAGLILPLIPAALAVFFAFQYESLTFDEE
jgi:hypothetical protein